MILTGVEKIWGKHRSGPPGKFFALDWAPGLAGWHSERRFGLGSWTSNCAMTRLL